MNDETFADYLTVPEVMELFNVESRYAIYTKGGIEEQYGIEPLKFAPKLRLYRVVDVVDHVEDKNALEMILARIRTQRGELVLADWLSIRQVLRMLKVSRQWFHVQKEKNNVQTIYLDDTTLYRRHDIERLADQGRQNQEPVS